MGKERPLTTQDHTLHTPASDPVKGMAHRLAKTLERHRPF